VRIFIVLFRNLFMLFIVAALIAPASPARAQGLQLIRDAEIEDTIRRMATPLFEAAGLTPSSVEILLVADKDLNAFVAAGQKLFMNTGLLTRAENASQVIGVIAHETGHISGGHLSRMPGAQSQGGATTLMAAILGAATALGTGRGDVGAAVFQGGLHVANRNFLSFTRTQEGSADQAALALLDQTKQSAAGLLSFMEILEGQDLLTAVNQDAYARTHPLSEDRIRAMRAHIAKSPYADTPVDPALSLAFERSKAKLIGYFGQPQLTLRQYPESDTSIPARYARAFAYSRTPDVPKALETLDSLLADVPDDPYFLELKAQVLFESGNIDGAIQPFRRAVEQKPNEPLLRAEFGRVLIESATTEGLNEAVKHLKFALSRNPQMPSAWRNLGIAQGRLGNVGESALALAEEAILQGRNVDAAFHAGKAAEIFPRGSPEWLQAEDLLLAIKNAKAK